ncbi:MAG TPA: DoxX family protein [Polyangiaceae bacterium]|nr:DoxX family protein [Polyangiaceae bacterium]
MTTITAPASDKKLLRAGLWTVQIMLALGFGMAGFPKTFSPMEELVQAIPSLAGSPEALVRFIGISELLGAIGLVLPALTRIQPRLTPLAAAGLALVMVLAALFHLVRGELSAMPINLVLGALAAFVVWGRLEAAPIAPRI